jgi:hypothetical protein
MAWIESHQAIGNHPKTILLAELLGCNRAAAVGYLQFLWGWTLVDAPDGKVGRFPPKVLARACHWSGKAEKFWDCLREAGFVDDSLEGWVIHDWDDYAGSLLNRRARDAERKRTSRGQATDVQLPLNGTSGGHPPDGGGTSILARGAAHNRTNQPTVTNQPTGPDADTPADKPNQSAIDKYWPKS